MTRKMTSFDTEASWVSFEGTNYDVGHDLGRWWARRLTALEESDAGAKYLRSKDGFMPEWLTSASWSKWCEEKEFFWPLLETTAHAFPEIIEEIEGMTAGARAGGLEASFLGVFWTALGETATERPHCSSLILPGPDRMFLAHNEEWTEKSPLCFADVKMPSGRFRSISYPFQLLGSVAGATESFAFQGNSIGSGDHLTRIRKDWAGRVPKTFLTRKMLDAGSTEDVRKLYQKHRSILPSHHFVCASDEAISIEVRPTAPMKLTDITAPACHANHFVRADQSVDEDWLFDKKTWNNDSAKRLRKLSGLKSREVASAGDARKLMLEMRKGNESSTSATIVFDLAPGRPPKILADEFFGVDD